MVDRTVNNKAYLYVDGEKSSTELDVSSLAADCSNAAIVFLGSLSGGASNFYKGMLDEVRVYGIALSKGQAIALYLYPAGNKGARISGARTTWAYGDDTTKMDGTSIYVPRLSAICAYLGSVILDTDGSIHTVDKDSYGDTTPGIFLGYDATEADYVLDIGDDEKFLRWDGEELLHQNLVTVLMTYTGNGAATQAITGAGFEAVEVNITRRDGSGYPIKPLWRKLNISAWSTYCLKWDNSTTNDGLWQQCNGAINSIDSDGFTVAYEGGGGNSPNENSVVYDAILRG